MSHAVTLLMLLIGTHNCSGTLLFHVNPRPCVISSTDGIVYLLCVCDLCLNLMQCPDARSDLVVMCSFLLCPGKPYCQDARALQAAIETQRKYKHVLWYTLFVAAYLIVLYLQASAYNSGEVVSTLRQALMPGQLPSCLQSHRAHVSKRCAWQTACTEAALLPNARLDARCKALSVVCLLGLPIASQKSFSDVSEAAYSMPCIA